MGIGSFFRKQFVDVIQWTESEEGVLAYRFPMQDMEIQYGAMLTVREGQMALFVDEGQVADAFGPGLHKLETQNVPLLTNLKHWDKLFQSPFKSDVYFFSTRLQTAQRWGTQQPLTIRDREFGAVRLRAFGMYSYNVADPVTFHRRLSGTREIYRTADVEAHLRNQVIEQIAQTLGASQLPFLDMAANQVELGRQVGADLAPKFTELGLTLASFTVESLSLPEELQKRLDEKIGMNIVGDLRGYSQFQAAQSIPIAAANEGGGAGLGAGLGAGMAMGQAMVDAMRGGMGGGGATGGGGAASGPGGASTADPAGFLTYLGGPSATSAARTVLRETPNVLAIILIGNPSARCNLRISAQSSTDNTPVLLPHRW